MIDHRDSKRTVESFAHKVTRRLVAAGAPPHIIEDVRQELWVAWCLARDSYDASKGAAFSTYLFNGMRLHINRWALNNVNKRHQEVIAHSLDFVMGDDENGGTFGEIVPSTDPTPEDLILRANMWERVTARLEPEARRFVELLKDPPQELLAELSALEARRDHGRAMGMSFPFINRITTTMIFDLMGIGRVGRMTITSQIESVVRELDLELE